MKRLKKSQKKRKKRGKSDDETVIVSSEECMENVGNEPEPGTSKEPEESVEKDESLWKKGNKQIFFFCLHELLQLTVIKILNY